MESIRLIHESGRERLSHPSAVESLKERGWRIADPEPDEKPSGSARKPATKRAATKAAGSRTRKPAQEAD